MSSTPVRCSPFALPFADGAFSQVRVRHVLQYLSKEDAIRLCRECWRVLEPGGIVSVVAPNLEYYVRQYEAGNRDLAMAGIWGEQALAQAHRWGYDRRSLPELLSAAGFVRARDVTAGAASLEKDERHVEAMARKHADRTDGQAAGVIERGRQVGMTIDDIRSDHVERYHFAAQFVGAGAEVLDCASGIGYGAHLLASETACAHVTAIDVDPEAISFARRHFAHDKVAYLQGDCLDDAVGLRPADCVVAFEVLEHVPRDLQFLARLRALLKPEGTLLISSPNEEVFPHAGEGGPYHVRHYTSEQLRDLVRRAGFRIILEASQDAWAVRPGFGGRWNLAVCRRDDSAAEEQFRMPRVDSPNPDAVDSRDRTIGLLLDTCHAWLRARAALTTERDRLREALAESQAQSEAMREDSAALRRHAEAVEQACQDLAVRCRRAEEELERHGRALRQLRRNPVVRLLRGIKRLLRL